MFRYFGRKARAAKSYPAPEFPLVIEPFAGSLAYSLHYRPASAIGIERDVNTVRLWHRLCAMTPDEIRDFRVPAIGERTTDRWLIMATSSNGVGVSRYRTMTAYTVDKFEEQRVLALKHHDYARAQVLYSQGDYRQAPDVVCTWFIDPPYQGVRDGYRHKDIDYEELAEWCMTRRGQVIVCEGPDGAWLPFEHHGTWQGLPWFGRPGKPIEEHVLARRTHARCAQCNVTFPASRADAKYCGARCRKRASRKS